MRFIVFFSALSLDLPTPKPTTRYSPTKGDISYILWCIASYYIIKLRNARDPISVLISSTESYIHFPLLANISWRSHADYRRSNRRCWTKSVDKLIGHTCKLGSRVWYVTKDFAPDENLGGKRWVFFIFLSVKAGLDVCHITGSSPKDTQVHNSCLRLCRCCGENKKRKRRVSRLYSHKESTIVITFTVFPHLLRILLICCKAFGQLFTTLPADCLKKDNIREGLCEWIQWLVQHF